MSARIDPPAGAGPARGGRPLPGLSLLPPEDRLSAELPRQVASRALAEAAIIVIWGWLATALLRPLVVPEAFDLPVYLAVLGGIAAVAGLYLLPAVRRSVLLVSVTGATLLTMAAAIAVFDVLSAPLSPANPALSLVGAASLVTGLVIGSWTGALTVLALALWHAWWELGSPAAGTAGLHAASVLTAFTNYVGARFVARSLAGSARQVGELVTRLLTEQRADELRVVRENSRTAARTDVHDTVLTTLSGIGAGWLDAADREALRAELQRDAERLADERGNTPAADSVDLRAALTAMVSGGRFASLQVRVDAPRPVLVDAVAADTVLLATREALVNVVKHAGVDTARVELCDEDGELRVAVRDAGIGFDPAAPSPGLGLRGLSVRVEDAGGRATVVSAPGDGTTVHLALPHRPARAVPVLWSAEGPRRGAMGLTVVASGAAALAFANQLPTYTVVAPQVAALTLVLAGDALAVGVLARRRRLPGWLSTLLVVRIPVVLLLSGVTLPGCASMGFQLFAGGGQVVVCVVITLLRPAREALAAVVAYGIGYGAVAAPLVAAGEGCAITALNQTSTALTYVLAGIWFTRALRRHGAIASDVLLAEERLLTTRTAQEVRAAERRRLLPVVRDIVDDTVEGLASGRLDPAAPEVRRRCRRDAQLVRSFLTQAGDGDDLITGLFERAVMLRDHGIDVAVRGTLPHATVAEPARAALLAAVDALIRAVTVSPWRGDGWTTVLRLERDVLVTVVLRGAAATLPAHRVAAVLADDPAAGLSVDRVEAVDDDLSVTCRLGLSARRSGSTGGHR